MNSMEREQKKRQLKGRIIETSAATEQPAARRSYGENEEEVARRAERRSKHKRLRLFFILVLILAIAGLAFVQYRKEHQFTAYTVAWEKQIPASESGFTEYVSFGENVLKYSKDGASYLDRSGNAVWSLSYQLKAPICYVNGEYAVIADQQGNAVYICSTAGCQGEAETLLPAQLISVFSF